MPQTDINEAFLFVTPPFSEVDFIVSRTAHLASYEFNYWLLLEDHHFWCSLAQGLPYLVITLKSTRARKKWAPAANTRDHNFLDRLSSTTTSRTEKFCKFWLSLLKSSKLLKIEKFKPNSKFLQFWPKPLQFWNISSIQRQKLLFKDQKERIANSTSIYTEIIEQTVSI